MNLLVITSSYPPHQVGGYEIRCKDVVESLNKRGHDVLIITTRCPEQRCKNHLNEKEIHRVLHQKLETSNILLQILNDYRDIRFIDKEVKGFKPDSVYLWAIQDLSNAILPYFSNQDIQIVYDEGGSGIAYLYKIYERGIYFYKNEYDPFAKKWLKNFIYLMANILSFGLIKPNWSWPKNLRVYFNSVSSAEYSKYHGVPIENIDVIYSGIDITKFTYRPRKYMNKPISIIVAGRLKPVKGTIDAVLLMNELLKKNIDVKLTIVGPTQDRKYAEEIVEKAKIFNITDKIIFQSMVDQNKLADMYRESDICFFPSKLRPGLSRVPLEAMASGCIVITYGNEGSKEIIENQETGFIIPEGDILEAASVIEKLINNPCLYQNISRNARSSIEREHSLEKYIDSIEAYLHDSLREGESI